MEFGGDDGSLKYAKDSGVYIEGVEAPLFFDRVAPKPLDISIGRGTAVIMSFGQSNAANTGEGHYSATDCVQVFNVFDMKYYYAIDPLPGASNSGGAVWGRLADKLVSARVCKNVLLVPIAMGGTFIKDWSANGSAHYRLMFALRRLKMAGVSTDIICWHQGEADANLSDMSAKEYQAQLHSIVRAIREFGVDAPVFVALATLCETADHPFKNRQAIREGQRLVVSTSDGILSGPDTDSIGAAHRADGCHFNSSGLELHAEAWLGTIVAHCYARQMRWMKQSASRTKRQDKTSFPTKLRKQKVSSAMYRVKQLLLKLLWNLGYIVIKRSDYTASQSISKSTFQSISSGEPTVDEAVSSAGVRAPLYSEADFNRIWHAAGVKSVISMSKAYALYSAVHYLVRARIVGDIVDCGDGGSAQLAMIAATLVALGDTSRRLILFDITGDPSHGGQGGLGIWGQSKNPIDGHTTVCQRKSPSPPALLIETGYPVRQVCTVNFPVSSLDFTRSISFLTVTPETYPANCAAINELISRVSFGGIVGAIIATEAPPQRDAVSEFIDRKKSRLQLWRITEDYRIGIKIEEDSAVD